MLKNFFKTTFRTMLRQRDYSLINLFGLTLGMTTCILILLYVQYELNWNTSHEKSHRIYRIQRKVFFKDNQEAYRSTGYPLAQELKRNFAEFEETTVLRHVWEEYLSSTEELTFQENEGYYAQSSLFNIFSYDFLAGNAQDALAEPFSIILTKELADKYFPEGEAIGQMIKGSINKSLKVTGIVENLPFNVDLRPDYLVSMQTFKHINSWKEYDNLANIGTGGFRTYALLHDNSSLEKLSENIYHFIDQYVPNNNKKLYLKPLADIHTNPSESDDIKIAYAFLGGISIFVLLLACINFINLATANAGLRKKEIGIRKVVGGNKLSMFLHFVGEFIIYAFIALVLSYILAHLALPYFNTIVQRPLEFNLWGDSSLFIYMIGLFLATAIIAGIYPALFLSSFQPIDILKGNISFGAAKNPKAKTIVRRFLVVFQFVISVNIIISTVFVSKQVQYMKSKYLGFDKENLIVCRVSGENSNGSFETLKSQLLQHPNITDATHSGTLPFRGSWSTETDWQGCAPDDKLNTEFNRVGYNFIDTFRMQLQQGRNFSKEFATDKSACLVNEEMVRQIGWQNPLGKKIDNNQFTIIGVIKDFHPYSVHEKIPPYFMLLASDELNSEYSYSIRVHAFDTEDTIAFVKKTFRSFFPNAILDAQYYTTTMRYGTKDVWEILEKIFFSFSIIAILIAANGLYGLISFAVHRRIKEVGIRKVLGSSVTNLYFLISKEFLGLLLIAVVISCPIGYFVSLSTPAAYTYTLQPIDYAISILFMLVTAIAATMYHTTKAVMTKPSETLRYE